jgi:hypothetical protein
MITYLIGSILTAIIMLLSWYFDDSEIHFRVNDLFMVLAFTVSSWFGFLLFIIFLIFYISSKIDYTKFWIKVLFSKSKKQKE